MLLWQQHLQCWQKKLLGLEQVVFEPSALLYAKQGPSNRIQLGIPPYNLAAVEAS